MFMFAFGESDIEEELLSSSEEAEIHVEDSAVLVSE